MQWLGCYTYSGNTEEEEGEDEEHSIYGTRIQSTPLLTTLRSKHTSHLVQQAID
jgi:hypothetical protein